MSFARVTRAQSTGEVDLYLPAIPHSQEVQTASVVQGPPEFEECKIVGWFTGIGEDYGQLFCTFLYLTSLQIAHEISPTPEPTPPPPTPTPEGQFEVTATGSDLVSPGEECRWVPVWRVCMVEIEFAEINTESCPSGIEVGVIFDDPTFHNAPIKPADYWLDEQGELWLKLEPLMYDASTGYEAERYTAKALCTE